MSGRLLFLSLSLGLILAAPVGSGSARAQSLTIADGLSVVASRGYEVRIAQAREAAAERGLDQARAPLKPRVSLHADHTWLRDQPEAIFAGGTSPLGEDSYLRYGITVNQLVTDFGRTGSQVDAARAAVRVRSGESERTRNEASLDFVTAYISLLRSERAVTLADLQVRRFESHLEDAKALYAAGEVTLNDLLAAEVVLSDARLSLITARDERKLALSRINYLLLRPLDSPAEAVDFPSRLDPVPDLEGAAASAAGSRPELKILDARIRAVEAELASTSADAYPSIFIRGGYAYEENRYRVHEDNWSATFGFTWDIYTGGGQTAGRRRIERELTALSAQREQIRELVNLEVRDSHRLLTGAIERSAVTKKAVTQAEESLRLQRSRYNEGEASATEVTDAVTALARAEDNHWSAIYGRLQAEARFLYATGEDLASVYSDPGTPAVSGSFDDESGENR